MHRQLKVGDRITEIDRMSTNSRKSRFRTGHVSTPSTPVEQIERSLDDGAAMATLFLELAEKAAIKQDVDEIVQLAVAAQKCPDVHRAYYVQRTAAQLMVAASADLDHDDNWMWARYLDANVGLLVPWLEQHPHEPELLNLLGLAVYELGHTSLARRLFEAVRDLQPDHVSARGNLRACRERMKRGRGVTAVADNFAPRFSQMRSRVKRIADLATRLPNPSVSLCMIVKDEEEMLPGCLEAISEHVDQMVVLDTGSSDRTIEIAESFGAEVHHFAWNGSFSDARNESLKYTTGDWVLYLDADEHLVADDGAQIRDLIRRPWIEGYYLIETHYTGDGELGSQSSHTPMRLFQKRDSYCWQGVVHEQLMHNFPTYLPERFENTSIRINHYGYLKDVVDDRSKRDRNLQLLMSQIEERRDSFTCFNIGSEYGAMKDWKQARPWFEEALTHAREEDKWQDQQFAPMMVSRAITARRATGDIDGALGLIDEALGWWPTYTDLVFERAMVLISTGDFEGTMREADRAMQMGDAPSRFVATEGAGSFQARLIKGTALREIGNLAAARREFESALDEAPHFLPTVLDLADVMLQQDDPAKVAAWFDDKLGERAKGASANMLLSTAFHESGAYDQADEAYSRVLKAQPGHGMALVARGELRLAQKRYEDAFNDATSLEKVNPMSARGARTAFLAAVLLDRFDELGDLVEIMQSSDQLSSDEVGYYKAWQAHLLGSDARPVAPSGPESASALMTNLEALAKLEETDEFERLYPLITEAIPDEQSRRLALGALYLRRRFADMAGDEYIRYVEAFGPDPASLTGLGKVATIKEMWEDAELFLQESLQLDPQQPEARRLLALIRDRAAS